MRRFVFAPRWVAGHVLVVVAVVSCALLGQWQWHRAEFTHSIQNYAYALQWPLFALFFLFMWWRMLRLESWRLDDEAQATADEARADESADGSGAADGRAGEPGRSAGGTETPVPPVAPRSPAPVLAPADPDDEDEGDRQLTAYNRMLAELAARDRAEH